MTDKFDSAALVADTCAELGPDFKIVSSQQIGNPANKYGCVTFVVESPSVLGIAKLFLRVEEFAGKVDTSVSWPLDHNRRQISASTYVRTEQASAGWPETIGASASRGAAALAKDINKRLIPRILPLVSLVEAGLKRDENREIDARTNHLLILKHLDYSAEYMKRWEATPKPQFPLYASTKKGAGHDVTFKVSEFGTASVELTGLSVAQVQAVIKALNLKG